MDILRRAQHLTRFVLVWFALSIGVAMASQTEIAYTGLIDTLNKLDSNFKIR